MIWWQVVLLVVGGLLAGIINAVAGGGSTLTVPLLVLAGVPGNVANGSNRIGILTSNLAAALEFRRLGVKGLSHVGSVVGPAVAGSLVGSYAVSQLTDDTFERFFGFLMIPLILLTIFKPRPKTDGTTWRGWVTILVFFSIGIYGGAVQAGVGLVLLAALTRAGFDLVTANNIKVLVNLAVTLTALPVFILNGSVRWVPAIILAAGYTLGGWLGARLAVERGDKYIRAMMIVATLVLAGSLLGLY